MDCRILLRAHVKNIGASPTNSQKIDISKWCARLLTQVLAFQTQAEEFLGVLNLNRDETEEIDQDWSGSETDNKSAEELSNLAQENTKYLSVGQVENVTLFLPSTFGEEECTAAGITGITRKEKKLRVGQANDALHQLRLAIGHKSFLFRKRLRNAGSKTRKTKAWDDINAIGNTVSHHRRVYESARRALVALGASDETISKFQIIGPRDVRSSTIIVNPNPRGQRNTGLPWFWGTPGNQPAEENSPLMKECTLTLVF